MENVFEPSLEELTVLLDYLRAATNDEHRRTEIASEISGLTVYISFINLARGNPTN